MRELESVVLTTDLAEHGLEQGDIGTIVLIHRGGKGYEVEFVALDGETVAVASVLASQVRAVVRREIAHARPVTEAPHNLRIDRGRAPMNTGAISE